MKNSNIPKHYALKGISTPTMDIIYAVIADYPGDEGFFLGNILKYLIRSSKKSGVEDLKKAKDYLERLIAKKTKNGRK